MKFLFMIVMIFILFVIHELGHYFAYTMFGIPSYFRKSVITPGFSPKETAVVSKFKGLVIALSGFLLSTILFVIPTIFFYSLWKVLLIGSIAGSSMDFIWAFTMLIPKKITISSGLDK